MNPITVIVLTFQRIFYVNQTVMSTGASRSTTSTVQADEILHILPTWPMSTYFDLNVALIAITGVMFLIAETIFGRLEGNFESERSDHRHRRPGRLQAVQDPPRAITSP